MDDYYMGGRRFGKALMIMYGFGAGTHADTAVGVAAQSYKLGMAGIWYQWLQIFNSPFYWLLASVFRRARCLTTADFYEMRYGPSLGLLYGFMGVAINLGFMGVMLLGSARLVEALSGGSISLNWAMMLMTASFVFYTLVGGHWLDAQGMAYSSQPLPHGVPVGGRYYDRWCGNWYTFWEP